MIHAQMTSLVAQMVKCLPTMWETWVQSLGRESLPEKEMSTHSRILAWKIPWTEEPGRLQSMGLQRLRHDFTLTFMLYKCYNQKLKGSKLAINSRSLLIPQNPV